MEYAQVTYPVRDDQKLVVLGSHENLGGWDLMKAVEMKAKGNNGFDVSLDLVLSPPSC